MDYIKYYINCNHIYIVILSNRLVLFLRLISRSSTILLHLEILGFRLSFLTCMVAYELEYSDHKKMDKGQNNDLHDTTQKTKDSAKQSPLKTSGRVNSSRSTTGSHLYLFTVAKYIDKHWHSVWFTWLIPVWHIQTVLVIMKHWQLHSTCNNSSIKFICSFFL
jgi:hypothetical protein